MTTTYSAVDHNRPDTQKGCVDSGTHSLGHLVTDTQLPGAEGPHSTASQCTTGTHRARASSGPYPLGDHAIIDAHDVHVAEGPHSPTDSAASHGSDDTQIPFASGAPDSPGSHRPRGTHTKSAAGAPHSTAGGQTVADTHARSSASGGPDSLGTGQTRTDTHAGGAGAGGPLLADPLLEMAAAVLDDLERVRIANENRLRQLTRAETDADGEERGFGLDEGHPDVARLAALVEQLGKAEHSAELNLKRMMRAHPLGPWVARTTSVGEKQAARLLASIGDPYWNELHDRPRMVSELWSFAGYGDAAKQVRRRGQKSNWSANAKMRTFLIATSCVKGTGPYRTVYDDARARYAEAVHAAPCVRCGPSGHPAAEGSPINPGHQHARALRAVSKAVLRDLWREAKAIHEETA